MQINTTATLLTALISAGFGFGLAFYLERILSRRMQKKSQRVLVSIAMLSFGYGLTALINEAVGFPLQGLQVRYDKLAIYLIVNILLIPIVLLVVAKLLGGKNQSFNIAPSSQSIAFTGSQFKYLLLLAGAISIAYFGYLSFDKNTSTAVYDLYERMDYRNCNSPFDEKPVSFKFVYKKETNEIFQTAVFYEDGLKKQQINTLDDCSILDVKNWTCGGKQEITYKTAKYTMVDGEFSYEDFRSSLKDDANCGVKIIKR